MKLLTTPAWSFKFFNNINLYTPLDVTGNVETFNITWDLYLLWRVNVAVIHLIIFFFISYKRFVNSLLNMWDGLINSKKKKNQKIDKKRRERQNKS
jgi:hypothetical protein